MKILLVTPYFFEPHRWNIAAYKTAHSLARLGHDVVVFTSGSKGQPRTETPEPHLKVYRFRDIFIPDPANYGILPFLSFRLASVLHRERPTHSIVFTHMFYTSQAVGWLKLFRRKVVLITDTFPGIDWFGSSRFVNGVLWVYARTAGLLPLRLADRVALLHDGLVPTAKRLGLRFLVHPTASRCTATATHPLRPICTRSPERSGSLTWAVWSPSRTMASFWKWRNTSRRRAPECAFSSWAM